MGISNTTSAHELSWIRRAAAGDHLAFAALVQQYEQRIYLYLRQMVSDADLASDLTQETFLAAYQALSRWQPPTDMAARATDLLSPWLYRIATNRAISLLRSQQSSYARPPFQPAARADVSLEDRVIGRELLRAALSTLDDADAACLVLHFVAGERYGEIAARLNISSEAVRKRVGRALTALRSAYTALETEAES